MVYVYADTKGFDTVYANSQGVWTSTVTPRTDGAHIFTAREVKNGVTGEESNSWVVNVDTTPPGPPHVSGIEYFGDAANEFGTSFTTAQGVKLTSNLSLAQKHLPAGYTDRLGGDDFLMGTGYYKPEVHVTLPGVADVVTICATKNYNSHDINVVLGTPNVVFYDEQGRTVAVTSTSIPVTDVAIGYTKYIATGGQHIASFTMYDVLYLSTIKWESATHAVNTQHLQVDAHTDGSEALALSQASADDSHHTATTDITNHIQDTLHLTLNDILSEAHDNLFIQDGHKQLAVTGDAGDVVELKVEDLAHNTWQDAGQVTAGGVQYEVYQHAGSNVELLVQQGVELHQVS